MTTLTEGGRQATAGALTGAFPAVAAFSPVASGEAIAADPRRQMEERLPRWVQPFLSWLTAKPASWERSVGVDPIAHVVSGFGRTGLGVLASTLLVLIGGWWLLLLPLSLVLTTSGLGTLQAVVSHHAAHGTLLGTRAANRRLGSFLSVFLLVKHFDHYQKEHMIHHSANKLLTEDDEFAQFIFDVMRLEAGTSHGELRRRVIWTLASPVFHVRWFIRRIQACLFAGDRGQAVWGVLFWSGQLALAASAGVLTEYALVWLLPVTVLYQLATAGRVLCEHRFPDQALIDARGKEFVCLATTGVFAGCAVPAPGAGPLAWARWWAEMLTIHLFARVFVLVGDAPAHDYHHRRPASKKWADYAHARQDDQDKGCPGYPLNYVDSWCLFGTIDRNLATLARARKDW